MVSFDDDLQGTENFSTKPLKFDNIMPALFVTLCHVRMKNHRKSEQTNINYAIHDKAKL